MTEFSYGSFENRGMSARIEAIGGAGTALNDAPFGHLYNPASGAGSERRAAGFSYALPFGGPEFDSFTGSFQTGEIPFDKNACAALSWQHYGSAVYQETTLYASLSTKVAGTLRAGMSAGLLKRHAQGKEDHTAPGINLGLLASLSPSLDLGLSIFNLNRPATGSGSEKAPLRGSAGFAYRPSGTLALGATLEKQEENNIRLRAGSEFRVLRSLYLRAGFSTQPSTVTGGAGFAFGHIRGDLALVHHPELGTGSWYTIRVSF